MIRTLIVAVTMANLAACAAVDRPAMTEFEPLEGDSFRFEADADVIYPAASPTAEEERMRWLRTWLDNNSMCADGYRITERKVVLTSEALLGEVNRIYYRGECT